MANSYVEYTGDGVTTNRSVPFGYILKAHVTVLVDGVSTSFSWLTNSTISISPAPANGALIRIKRSSSPTARLVDYTVPGTLTEEDLDNDSLQAFYLAQEANDTANDALGLNDTGDFTARDLQIKDVATPTDDQDAVTKAYVDDAIDAVVAGAGGVVTSTAVNTATGLTGGGDLSTSRTIALNISALTEDATPDTASDFLLSYDSSASSHKKVKPASLGYVKEADVSGTARSFTKAQRGSIVALTDAATIATDLSLGNNFSVTLGGNRTLGNPTNITAGQHGSIFITQDGTGSRTLAYGSYWKFEGGTAPVATTTANAVDRLDYAVIDSTHIHARLAKDVK